VVDLRIWVFVVCFFPYSMFFPFVMGQIGYEPKIMYRQRMGWCERTGSVVAYPAA
jgi:hypothetical protein